MEQALAGSPSRALRGRTNHLLRWQGLGGRLVGAYHLLRWQGLGGRLVGAVGAPRALPGLGARRREGGGGAPAP